MKMSTKQEFINKAKDGKVLTQKCGKCGELHLSTVYFCTKCGSRETNFKDHILEGQGSIATYTIITVPPAGFEKYTPYAWVVLDLDDSHLRISGFMANIATPKDLSVGDRAKITGFDDRGILVEKQQKNLL